MKDFFKQNKNIIIKDLELKAIVIIGDKGIVQYVNGSIITGLNITEVNLITKEEAIVNAIYYINADLYTWEHSLLEKKVLEDPNATNYPSSAQLVTAKERDESSHKSVNYQLRYKAAIQALEPISFNGVYINANTGEIFTTDLGLFEEYSTMGQHWTWYNGWFDKMWISTCSFRSNYKLLDLYREILK